jgi:cell cycle protein kinase DBF2
MTPTRGGRTQLGAGSPNKGQRQVDEADPFTGSGSSAMPGSPTKQPNQENTPPTGRQTKEMASAASQARHEQYRPQDSSVRSRASPTRGMSAEDMEKLQLPRVKRLANVAQICGQTRTLFTLPMLTRLRLFGLLL